MVGGYKAKIENGDERFDKRRYHYRILYLFFSDTSHSSPRKSMSISKSMSRLFLKKKEQWKLGFHVDVLRKWDSKLIHNNQNELTSAKPLNVTNKIEITS